MTEEEVSHAKEARQIRAAAAGGVPAGVCGLSRGARRSRRCRSRRRRSSRRGRRSARPSPAPASSRRSPRTSPSAPRCRAGLKVYVPVDQVGKVVKKGDPLFLVDNRQLKAQLKYYEANLAAAEAQLAKLQGAAAARKKCRRARPPLRWPRPGRAADRTSSPVPTNSAPAAPCPPRTFANALCSMLVAKKQLAQARANSPCSRPAPGGRTSRIAQAAIEQAKAQIEQTKTDLERCWCGAPVDGKVLQVNVRARRVRGHAAVAGPGRARRHQQKGPRPRGHRRARHPALQGRRSRRRRVCAAVPKRPIRWSSCASSRT